MRPALSMRDIFLSARLKRLTNPIEADKITREETYRECRRDGPVDDTATGRNVVTGAKFRRARLWKIGRRQKLFRQPRAVRGVVLI